MADDRRRKMDGREQMKESGVCVWGWGNAEARGDERPEKRWRIGDESRRRETLGNGAAVEERLPLVLDRGFDLQGAEEPERPARGGGRSTGPQVRVDQREEHGLTQCPQTPPRYPPSGGDARD